ncbi:MAG: VCBS repeat-containing protein [Armatimonadetes bacterium]|nr:VCBS repeat-containing protein [Armatimonadota bacterium]
MPLHPAPRPLLWIALLLFTCPARAEPPVKRVFSPPVKHEAESSPVAVLSADVNRDGKPDLLTANSKSKSVSLWLGQGNGAVGPRTTIPVNGSPVALDAGDLSGDGIPDIATANGADGTVSLLIGKGDGTFTPGGELTVGGTVSVLAVADFNGDGRADLAATTLPGEIISQNPRLLVYPGRGTEGFGAPVAYPLTREPNAIVAADLNRDRKIDLVVGTGIVGGIWPYNTGSVGSLQVFVGKGDGTFTPATYPGYTRSIGVGDLNEDGIPDLVTTHADRFRDMPGFYSIRSYYSVWIGRGDGTFIRQPVVQIPFAGPALIREVTGDGHLDLITLGYADVAVYPGDGDGTFSHGLYYRYGSQLEATASADFNGDGTDDLAVTTARFEGIPERTDSMGLLLSRAREASFFTPPRYVQVPHSTVLPSYLSKWVAGDFNEDGLQDVAVVIGLPLGYGALPPVLMLGRPDGSLSVSSTLPRTDQDGPGHIQRGDFNGDSHLDLITGPFEYSYSPYKNLHLYLGDGKGKFTPMRIDGSYPELSYFDTLDFNGDGRTDLYGSGALYLSSGNGAFAKHAAPESLKAALATGDFNADGRADLLVNNAADAPVLYLGNAAGQLNAPRPLTPGFPLSLATTGDFNGDGKLDLLHASGERLSLLPGQGDGSFGGAVHSPYPGSPPSHLAVADFNRDSRLDLAVGSATGNDVTVMRGRGDGTFEPDPGKYFAGLNPRTLDAGDYNGDGRPDLAAGSSGTNEVALLLAPPDLQPGDIDRNASVDVLDALLSLRIGLGLIEPTEAQRKAADVNRDGVLNLLDTIRILQVSVGLRLDFGDRLPQSDAFGAGRNGLSSFWKARQTQRRDAPLPTPGYHYYLFDGKLSLTSADYDVWMGIWEPFFIYQDGIYGDFTMQVKVEIVPTCSELSAVGLMVAGRVPAFYARPEEIPTWGLVHATKGLGVEAKWGGGGGGQSSLADVMDPNLKPPYWLRLDRQGSTLSFFTSTDGGKMWKPVVPPVNLEQRGWTLRDPITAGIVQQTHCEATPGTAFVSNFQAGPLSQAGKLPGDTTAP